MELKKESSSEVLKYENEIKSHLGKELSSTSFSIPFQTFVQTKQGKVRDIYILSDCLILVASDRVSGFDRHLASIPYKGQVLTQISLWWFKQLEYITPNHILASPDPNIVICKKCTVFPVEFVVRGYITGTTNTSIWTHYSQGIREYCGHHLPEGLKKNQKLEKPLVTPTTKSDLHDELISAKQIVESGLMTASEWNYCEAKALEIFSKGQEIALEHGLLLVDTKYEFGKDEKTGEILLIDEVHTPDSSRYWLADSFESRFQQNLPPENIDKDIIRNWYKENCDPYKVEILPKAPDHLVILLAQRYIQLYELITGKSFEFPNAEENTHERVQKNLIKYFSEKS